MATTKLTEKSLATLPPATNHARTCPCGDACKCALQAYYWDTDLVGFGVVAGRTGTKTFVARASVGGKKRRVKIGAAGAPRPDGNVWTVALARIEARQLLGRMSAGEDPNAGKRATSKPVAKPSAGPTLREALALHVANMRTGRNRRRRVCSPRSIHKMETEVPLHLEAWLDKPLVELTAHELQKACERIERETAPVAGAVNPPGRAQSNKLIAHVSAIWNAADRLHELAGRNPATRVIPGALMPRKIRINEGTFADWYAKVSGLSPVRRDLQLVSLFTSIRSDGLRHMRWEDLDGERRLLHVTHAKGDKPYAVPLVETVREILERRRADNAVRFAPYGGDHGWIFPSLTQASPFRVIPVATVNERRIDRTREDEEGRPMRVQYLPGVHANRRTFNSIALEIGIPTEARLALMNHSPKGVNERHYGAVQSWDLVRDAAERVEAELRERLGMPPLAPAAAPTAPVGRPMLRAV